MADFFQNKDDLSGWIKTRESGEAAASELLDVINTLYVSKGLDSDDANSIFETCKSIYNSNDKKETDDVSGTLFNEVLAKYGLVTIQKNAMNKSAQQSRQRNNWVHGDRNKWNRVVDGFNDGTPWRVDRDKMYNFTHYYTDAISFDDDPTRVYSGEAMWRMYVMDKFSSEVQDKDGRWVGGYINNRFFVFPDAGTPSNPDVDRMHGNQMELALGEKTRKPRPHQYSTERRLEESRGVKTVDIVASSKFNKMQKISSKVSDDVNSSNIYQVFKDCLDMRDDNIDYEKRLAMISEHYKMSVTSVAQIDKVAENLLKKHDGIGYTIGKIASSKRLDSPTVVQYSDGHTVSLPQGLVVDDIGNGKYRVNGQECQVVDGVNVDSVPLHGTPEAVSKEDQEELNNAFDVDGEKKSNTQDNTADIKQDINTDFPVNEHLP